MARNARAAPKNEWKRTDAPARNFGRGCNRIQAREITPSVPSEPMNMRSRLDTAADARPSPERRQRGADATGPVHHSGNLCFVAWICDHVGRAIVVAEHGSHVVWIGFAVGVRDPVVVFARTESGK